MQSITIQRAVVMAIYVAITPIQAPRAVGSESLPTILAMGPDPGGKTGAGVTPQTTRTDHPAAGGPQGPTKPDSGPGRDDRNGKQPESREPAPAPPSKQR